MKASLFSTLFTIIFLSFTVNTGYGQTCVPTITAGGPTSFCAPGSVVLSANTGAGFTYQWQRNNVNIPGATSATYSATTTGVYRVNLTAGPCTGFSNSISVLVSPTALITSGGNTTFCAGESLVLTAANGPAQTYQWRRYGVNIAGANSITYTATQSGNYTCRVTNSCGTAVSNAILVTVQTPAAAPGPITTVGGTIKVCPGTSVSYSIAPVTGATSYTWTPPAGGNVINGQGTTTVLISYGAGVLPVDTLKVKVVNSCGDGANKTLAIRRNDPVTPGSITGDVYGLCNLDGVSYSISPVAGVSYVWNLANSSGTVITGQGTGSITVDYTSTDFTDSIKVVASNGCGVSAVRKKTVRARPETPQAITGSTAICANQQDVPYSISPVASAINYTWIAPLGAHISDGVVTSNANVLTTTATSVTIDYGSAGGVLKVKARNSCGKSSNQTANIAVVCRTTNPQENNNELQVNIYPNPSSGEVNISLDKFSGNEFEVTISDMAGRIIHSEIYHSPELQLAESLLLPGIYMIEVKDQKERKLMRFVRTDKK